MLPIRLTKVWLALTLFSIAMSFMESAVVVYLREISYPGGFEFPLAYMKKPLYNTEIIREIATLIMLAAVAYLGGKNSWQRLAWFIYCFGIWDIFFYVFLKLLINWPDSLLTWDLLFLIPVIWIGPVIAPVILSLTMIFMACIIIFSGNSSRFFTIKWYEWLLIGCGSVAVYISFSKDYTSFMLKHHSLPELLNVENFDLIQKTSQQYIPLIFSWPLFLTGEIIILAGLLALLYRNLKKRDNNIEGNDQQRSLINKI
jgi:hypothetical protein